MFEKKEIKEGKLNEKDVGYLSDAFFSLCQSCGYESHVFDDFRSNPNKENLERYNKARRRRTILMENILEHTGANLINEQWCELKHLCTIAMGIQELVARNSMLGNLKEASELVNIHKEIYLEFLIILGVNENNINENSPTSA